MPRTSIISIHNEQLKQVRRLARRRERDRSGRFVAEGEDLLTAADQANWPALERYCLTGSGLPGRETSGDALASVSALGSSTRTLAVYEQRWAAPAGPLCVYLHGVADPGNVGTILRGALAFGAATVVLGPGCADPYGPKATRASMGAIFAVPVARATVSELPGERVALVAHGGDALRGPDMAAELSGSGSDLRTGMGTGLGRPPHPLTILVGAERGGLPEEVVGRCHRVAHIPIAGESLNAAMAATVALYELTRWAPPSPTPSPFATAPANPRMAST